MAAKRVVRNSGGTRTATTTCDVVILGAGSAGCVVARRLVDAGLTVVLLEAGPPDIDPLISDATRWMELLMGQLDWGYMSVPQPACAGRRMPSSCGRVLGGSSSINGAIYARGCRSDYDGWSAQGASGWSFDDVWPLMLRSEDFDRGSSPSHGAGGPLAVFSRHDVHPLTAAMMQAAEELGVRRNLDHNCGDLDGVDFIQLNIRDGIRQSTAAAFLGPVRESARITMFTGAVAQRLVFDGDRCVGVDVVHHGAERRVLADREVVLSAGAYGTPKLLMLSGIGPAAHLRAHGISVRVGLDGVGANLQDHVSTATVFRTSRPVPTTPVGQSSYQAHMFLRSRRELAHPDIQFLFVNAPLAPPGTVDHGFSILPILVAPASRGMVRLASRDPAKAPLIDPACLSRDEDLDVLVHAFEQARELVAQPALNEWRNAEVIPGEAVQGGDQLRHHLRTTALTFSHPVGTCRMGADKAAVVDPELRVHGCRGLRVVDASVMPTIPAANTHATTVMIGERGSDLILAQ